MSIDSVPVPIQLRRTAETPAGPRPGERPRARVPASRQPIISRDLCTLWPKTLESGREK